LAIFKNKILHKKNWRNTVIISAQILKIMRICVCKWTHQQTAYHCVGHPRSLTVATQ